MSFLDQLLQRVKLGSFPYRRHSQWDAPVSTPTTNQAPVWKSDGTCDWQTITAPMIGSGAALTKTDDTNVTLTLGGTPSAALLAASSITAGWTGTLAPARGGTGANLSATGGASQVLKQVSAGANVTVGQLAFSDISGSITTAQIPDRTRTMPVVPAGTIGASSEWIILAGAPDFAQRNSVYGAIAFDAVADESVQWLRSVMVPEDFSSWLDVVLIWTNLGAGAGNVRWRIGYSTATDAQAFPILTAINATLTAPAQNVLMYSAFSIAPSVAAGALLNFSVARLGSDVADTLGNDSGFVGLRLRYTADS